MKKRYGLIGYPVKHSFSPAMHNAAFEDLGIDAEYELFDVKPEDLEGFFAAFKDKLSGANVTIPHKEASIEYLDEVRPQARLIGAVNTVILENDKLIGDNTDELGFIEALEVDLGFKAAGKRAVVFGAGGAARAVTFALYSKGIKNIFLIDLDAKRAASLAIDLAKAGCDAAAIEFNKDVVGGLVLNADLLVNATPCGMKESDPELIESKFLHKGLSVFDLIYNPDKTALIKRAKEMGCRTANGLGMLLYQGVKAFELWTKKKPNIKVMKQALRKALGQA
ncbi:MAG: shikimate dehydrogenase [Candidatus Omnitrophota bacterium]